jgi:hypothetical protein
MQPFMAFVGCHIGFHGTPTTSCWRRLKHQHALKLVSKRRSIEQMLPVEEPRVFTQALSWSPGPANSFWRQQRWRPLLTAYAAASHGQCNKLVCLLAAFALEILMHMVARTRVRS